MKFEDVIKSLYLQSKLIKLEEKEYVIKCYSTSAGIKWYFISSFFKSYPYASSPRERMNREIDFFTRKWSEIGTPKIIDMDYETNCIMRDYIKGRSIETEEDFLMLGKAFKIIHENGLSLGDTKIENFIVNEKIYVIDAEQAIQTKEEKYFAWDILVFLLFLSYKYINDLKNFEKMSRAFLNSYKPTQKEISYILDIRNINVLTLFPPMALNLIKKIIAEL
jgi:tRNA A-37 threonylcarbamoyl transferase component Bud32